MFLFLLSTFDIGNFTVQPFDLMDQCHNRSTDYSFSHTAQIFVISLI